MINKKDFAKMARDIFKKSQGVQNPQLIHPTREWMIGLAVGILIFVGAAAWSVTTYNSYRNVSVNLATSPSEEVVVYREAMVKAALELYQERAVINQQLISGSDRPVETQPAEEENTEPIETATTSPVEIEDELSEVINDPESEPESLEEVSPSESETNEASGEGESVTNEAPEEDADLTPEEEDSEEVNLILE